MKANRRRLQEAKPVNQAQLSDRLDPFFYLEAQERERAFIRWLRYLNLDPVRARVLEVGCGDGRNLAQLIRLGFSPNHLQGVDILAEAVRRARNTLPSTVHLRVADALRDGLGQPGSFDVVLQSTVFSSILDDSARQVLALRMWDLARPGGGILWHDFVYDNPRNPKVRGVPLRRVRELFPLSTPKVWRMTPAPPLARPLARIHPAFYSILAWPPPLRTHIFCWLPKPVDDYGTVL